MAGDAESPAPGGLRLWTDDQRREALTLYCLGHRWAAILRRVKKTWPQAHPYTRAAIQRYIQSKAGKAVLKRMMDAIRKDAPIEQFAVSGPRIKALNECLVRLLNALRDIKKPLEHVKDIVAINAEVRQTMEQMRKEMGAYGIEDLAQDSALGAFLREWDKVRMEHVKKAPEIEEAIFAEPS